MKTKAITIHVAADAAELFETVPEEQQRKLEALLSLKLSEIAGRNRPLEQVMSEISRHAAARGLTPEALDSILNDD